jgi:hypothetical protein
MNERESTPKDKEDIVIDSCLTEADRLKSAWCFAPDTDETLSKEALHQAVK